MFFSKVDHNSRRHMEALLIKYVKDRANDPFFVGWVAGSISLLCTAYVTSPGAKLAKKMKQPSILIFALDRENKERKKGALSQRGKLGRIASLYRIAIPSLRSREVGNMLLTTVLIFARTYMSISMAKASGVIGKVAIEGNMKPLLWSVLKYLQLCFPTALLNVSLDYLGQMQELYFRENMMRYFSSRYLSDKVFFRLAGLHQIDNVDHRLTEDITHWSRVASVLYPAVLRPLTEATAFTLMMSRIAGWKTCGLIYSYYLSVALVVSFTTPNINWLTDQRLEKESAFRSGHQQVISYGEELCISAGQNFSQESLTNVFTNVTNQARLASFLFGRYNMLEVFLSKYCSVLLGYLVGAVSLDHLKKKSVDRGGDGSLSSLSGTFSEAGYSFQILAKAIGRLLWNIKLMLLVTGYSSRIMHLDDALEIAEFEAFRQNQQIALSPRASVLTMNASLETSCCQSGGEEHFGRVIRGEHIEFVDVPLVLPTGEVLCPSLSFYVKPGMNLLIMGPNGCGKSSTFRLLGELWPLQDGQVIKPEQEQIYYVPQRPYMYDGTLFEQIIYPLKKKEVNVSESDLYSYLEMAGLESILGRLNVTWDSRLSWNDDTLSLGEKQRLAMARLFFHRPRFAILDECSSLVDLNVEEQLYTHCHNLGITLITIAHRRSVWRHHNYILKFDGLGGYVFAPLRFEENNTQLVLDGIISASKRDDVGQTLKLSVSDPQLGEDEEPAPEL